MLADTFEHVPTDLTVAQLPFLESDSWLALLIDTDRENIGDKLSIVMQLPQGYSTTGAQSGLLLDDFVEVIPNKSETTGVVFHFDQPNSEPPQTLLLAVTPEVTGSWKWQDLLDTLNETLDMAKKRAVEPDKLGNTAYAHLLPAIMTAVTRYSTTFSVDLGVNAGYL